MWVLAMEVVVVVVVPLGRRPLTSPGPGLWARPLLVEAGQGPACWFSPPGAAVGLGVGVPSSRRLGRLGTN